MKKDTSVQVSFVPCKPCTSSTTKCGSEGGSGDETTVTETDTQRLTHHKQRIVWWFDLLVTSRKDRVLESVVSTLNFRDKANNTYLFTQSPNSDAILSSTSTRAARSTDSNPSTRLFSPLSTANCITPQQDCNGGTQPLLPNCASTSLASALFFSSVAGC